MLAADNIVPEIASDLQPASTSGPGASVRSVDRRGLPALGLPTSGPVDAAALPGRTVLSEGKTSRGSSSVAAVPLSTLSALPALPFAVTELPALAVALSPGERLSRPSAMSQAERLQLDRPPVKAYDLAAAVAAANRVPVQVAPRSTNSGAQRTQEGPKALLSVPGKEEDDALAWVHEGFLIDWLRFTVTSPEQQALLLSQWRSEPADWSEMESGHMGYRKCYRRDGVAIYYDHAQEGRGICFDVSGKGCRSLEGPGEVVRRFGWPSLLAVLTNTPGVHITRLDAAIDDRKGLVDLERVKAAVHAGTIVSRFKSSYCIEKNSLTTGEGFGLTVNFGSRVSDMMVRFYDKGAEQKQAASAGPWVRVELEAKDENAEVLAKLLSVAAVPGEVVAGVLRNYISFRERSATDKNRRRWPECAWWLEFLGGVERLRLALGKVEVKIERVKAWVERQVLPSLAMLYLAAPSGKRLLADMVQEGRERLRPKHQAAIDAYRAQEARRVPLGVPTGF